MKQWIVAVFCMLTAAVSHPLFAENKGYLVLESYADEGVPRFISGDTKLARMIVSPASTFKIVIAWAGLETGTVALDTAWEVGDQHVPGAPREINLRQALYYSSNDYFITLAQKIGKEQLTEYVKQCGMFRGDIPEDWLGEEWRPVIKGGKLDTTPMQNHLFMRRLAFGNLTDNKEVSRDLIRAMEWPTSHPMIQLFGMTGVWGGGVWFNGFGVKQRHRRVRTVFFQGGIEKRTAAIMQFYRGWDIAWTPALNKKLEQ